MSLTLTLTISPAFSTPINNKTHHAHPHDNPRKYIVSPGKPFLTPVWNGKTHWSECSIGYPFTHNNTQYFLTASHCFFNLSDTNWGWFFHHDTGTNIYSEDDINTPIGEETISIPVINNSDLDVTVVRLFPGKTRIPRLTQYDITPLFDTAPRINENVCMLGENVNKPRCGVIRTHTYVNTINIYGSPYHWNTVMQATYPSYPGDSGGLVYSHKGVIGINVGALEGNNNGIFVPITTIIHVLKQHGFDITRN